jgi:hypothetical protein
LDEVSMSFRSAFRISLFVWSVAPLACAVATGEPDADPDDGGGSGGGSLIMGGGSSGGAALTTAGKSQQIGGTGSVFGGTGSSTAGKGGSTSSGGKTSSAGEGGSSSSAGQAGSSSAGSPAAGSGSGGTGTGSCGALRTWVPATSMMIEPDEVIQWMGKRYKATQAIDWTNAECKPDAPAAWCAAWFTADGSC